MSHLKPFPSHISLSQFEQQFHSALVNVDPFFFDDVIDSRHHLVLAQRLDAALFELLRGHTCHGRIDEWVEVGWLAGSCEHLAALEVHHW